MDEEAFYEQYRKRILIFVRNKISYHEDSEDICQETLQSAVEAVRFDKVENPENMDSFLYGVCKNKINDWIRQKYQKPVAQASYSEHPEFPDPAPNILEDLIKDEERKTIDKVINNLNFTDKRIIYLRYYRSWPYDEIAGILNMKTEAVRKAAQRARKKIYMLLKKKGTFKSVTFSIIILLID